MINFNARPEVLCDWFGPILARSARLHNLNYLRWNSDLEDLHITMGFKPQESKTIDDDPDLPADLWKARPKTRDVYRAIRTIWESRGADPTPVMPADIIEWLAGWYAQQEIDPRKRKDVARSTVQHALTDLQQADLVQQHPDGGWLFQRRQGRIDEVLLRAPREKRNTSPVGPATEITHASRVTRDDREAHEGRDMFGKRWIWVPGDKPDFGMSGLVVEDVATERQHLADGKIGEMVYETRTGRTVRRKAIRLELVRADDQHARVKLSDGTQIKIKVLGDWHTRGLTRAEELESASN